VSGLPQKAIENSYKLREVFLNQCQDYQTDCYRLFNGQGEGIPGFIVERYGTVLIFQFHVGKCHLDLSQMQAIADWYVKTLGIKSVYLKRFVSDRSGSQADEDYYNSTPFWGEQSADVLLCKENGLVLEIHPYEGFSTGLFLDQRNNRRFLRNMSSGLNVLNCFSYTCAFSVACALNSGKTTSVDLSRRYLNWGKRNFEHNQLKPELHQFYVIDVFEQFQKAKKLGKEYDMIILDPPSFSRNPQGGVFSVKRDMKELVSQAVGVLSPRGTLFVSTNLTQYHSDGLESEIIDVLKQKKRNGKKLALPEVPFDFSTHQNPLAASCFKVG